MSIHNEFLTEQDIFDYVALNQPALFRAIEENESRPAARVLDSTTCLVAAMHGSAIMNMTRPAKFAVMICAEAIEAYEISVGLRDKSS